MAVKLIELWIWWGGRKGNQTKVRLGPFVLEPQGQSARKWATIFLFLLYLYLYLLCVSVSALADCFSAFFPRLFAKHIVRQWQATRVHSFGRAICYYLLMPSGCCSRWVESPDNTQHTDNTRNEALALSQTSCYLLGIGQEKPGMQSLYVA